MDPSQLAGLGVVPALIVLIGYLLVNGRADRRDYRVALNALRRTVSQHEKRIAHLESRLDEERALRRAAEDKAADAERRLRLIGGTG